MSNQQATTPGMYAYAAWHGIPIAQVPTEWEGVPENDRIRVKWETVGAAVAAAERERCIAAVDAEQELQGEIPQDLAKSVLDGINNQDVTFFIAALRLAVKMTKKGIRERIVSIVDVERQ